MAMASSTGAETGSENVGEPSLRFVSLIHHTTKLTSASSGIRTAYPGADAPRGAHATPLASQQVARRRGGIRPQGPQGKRQVPRRLEAFLSVLLQTVTNDAFELGRYRPRS